MCDETWHEPPNRSARALVLTVTMVQSLGSMSIVETAAEVLQRAQATLATGRLRAARAQFIDAAQRAALERAPDVRAEAAIGAGGLWLHELRITDERAAFLNL